MKELIKKECKLIAIVLFFIFIGPIIINLLFKQSSCCELFVAEWNASAALSYYGTIIAAIIAVYGVFFTIQYSQKSYKEDVRNRALPFIVIDKLYSKINMDLSQVIEENRFEFQETQGYVEYKLVDYYCILENGEIFFKTGLTKNQQMMINNRGLKRIGMPNKLSLEAVNLLYVPIEIENIGNGTAIRMRCGINRKDSEYPHRKYLPTISLKTFTPIMLHIFSEDCSKDSPNLGNYVLSFYYDDIYSNSYEQHFDIIIGYKEEVNNIMVAIDMSHTQIFLGRRINGKIENGDGGHSGGECGENRSTFS